jgi:hypothetical protein
MAATTAAILDSIVLAFSKSAMREVVGTDALRTLLAGLAKEMVTPDSLKLQPLWSLLEDQPGFVKNDAAPPMLLIKTWQTKLGVIVELPDAFGEVSPEDCARYAATIKVDAAELDKLLAPPPPPVVEDRVRRPTGERAKKPTEPSRPRSKTLSVQPLQVVTTSGPRRFPWAIAALVLVLVAAIVVRFATREPSSAVELSTSAVSSEIPLASARQNEAMVVATLSDPAWLETAEDARRKQLEAALEKIRSLDATSLSIVDGNGMLVASASNRGKLVITFPGAKKKQK